MSFHPEKYQVFHLSRSRKKLLRQSYLHGQAFQEVDGKYLGVMLTSDAVLEAHINVVINKARWPLGLLGWT